MADTVERLARLETEMQGVRGDVVAAKAILEEIRHTLADQHTEGRVAAERWSVLDERVAGVEERLERVEERIEKRLDALDAREERREAGARAGRWKLAALVAATISASIAGAELLHSVFME